MIQLNPSTEGAVFHARISGEIGSFDSAVEKGGHRRTLFTAAKVVDEGRRQ